MGKPEGSDVASQGQQGQRENRRLTVDELPDYAALLVVREQLLSGTYTPQPVKRVEIPKPDGGVRKLGIPVVPSYCVIIQY